MTQSEYIEILFNDLGFNFAQKKAWLLAEYGCKYVDEVSSVTRHRIIERLKEMKHEHEDRVADTDGQEELDFHE